MNLVITESQFRSLKPRLNESILTVYRSIDNDYIKGRDNIEYFAINKSYAVNFGGKCYEVKLDISNARILKLDKWNSLYSSKTGKNGNLMNRHQGLFVIGETSIESNYNKHLEFFRDALGDDLANDFLIQLSNCDAIYGEDAGYSNEFVYAVKNKSMITNVELVP